MKKQLIISGLAVALIAVLYLFGRTTSPQKPLATSTEHSANSFNIEHFIADAKQQLTPSQSVTLGKLENSVKRGDVSAQQIAAYTHLAAFWRDSVHLFEPYAWYLSEAAKLDKSEKNLTFAAQLILANLRGEPDGAKLSWKTDLALDLFQRALELNPDNDETKIGIGSCYVYGKSRSNPEETMKGIQVLRDVVAKDSNNMRAQLVLGIGGYMSKQYDKAIYRLKKVLDAEPDNLEAMAYLGDVYADKGDKQEAIRYYELSKKLANNPEYTEEVNRRIKSLQK